MFGFLLEDKHRCRIGLFATADSPQRFLLEILEMTEKGTILTATIDYFDNQLI